MKEAISKKLDFSLFCLYYNLFRVIIYGQLILIKKYILLLGICTFYFQNIDY